MTTRHPTIRRGFTLVEMMVAMALSLGIMLILAEGFKSSLDFVRLANANGQLMNQLEGTGNRLEHDLLAKHFTFEATKPNGGVRLSDQMMHQTATWTPPTGGFFRIEAGVPNYAAFTDIEGNAISTATTHKLHFTSILRGGSDAEQFTTDFPAGSATVYRSRAAEVAWFLVPTGELTSPTGLPLYNLVRRYRLVALDDDTRSTLDRVIQSETTTPARHQEVISVPVPNTTPPRANTLATVMNPANRLAMGSQFPQNPPVGATRYGEDIVATNVLSFQVLVWGDAPPNPNAGPWPRQFPTNTEAPFDYLPGNGVLDTAVLATTTGVNRIRVRALQITLIIADTRVGIARSRTWKLDM